MPIFVKAHQAAGKAVRAYTRKGSALTRASKMLGVRKIRLVKSHAYRMVKKMEEHKMTSRTKLLKYHHRLHRLNRLENVMRSRGIDPHGNN